MRVRDCLLPGTRNSSSFWPPRSLRARGRLSVLSPSPQSPQSRLRSPPAPAIPAPWPRSALPILRLLAADPSPEFLAPVPLLLNPSWFQVPATPIHFFCPGALLPRRLLSIGTHICAAISASGRLPASAVPQVSTRLAVHPSVPPGADADHAQRLPPPTSRVPVVHPGGIESACQR